MQNKSEELNYKTGYKDGIKYTFGDSTVCVALVEHLEKSSSLDKIGKIHKNLMYFAEGLKLLTNLPETKIKIFLISMWREKYQKIFSDMLTKEQGQTYLLNLVKANYSQILQTKDS